MGKVLKKYGQERGRTAPLNLNLATDGIVLLASRPGLFTSERDRPVPTQKWAWWAPEQVLTLGRKEKSHPCRESINDSSVVKPVA